MNLLIENVCILIMISFKAVPKAPIINKSALVKVVAWYRSDKKVTFEPMLTKFNLHKGPVIERFCVFLVVNMDELLKNITIAGDLRRRAIVIMSNTAIKVLSHKTVKVFAYISGFPDGVKA